MYVKFDTPPFWPFFNFLIYRYFYIVYNWIIPTFFYSVLEYLWVVKCLDSRKFYRVALKTRSNRAHLKTLTPRGGRTLAYMRMTSMMLKRTTRLSKRLNNDTKYPCSPKLYIFSNISRVKRMTKNKLAIAEKMKVFV